MPLSSARRTGFPKVCFVKSNINKQPPGGQHVTTSDTAVRITHLPSGVSAVASEERSQTRNRELALLRVQEKLHLVAEARHASEKAAMRLDHDRLERGGAVRTFAGLPPEEVR